ncbi:exo-alpha-sialidase [Brachyspira aalborgi]|uniref:exo-alpha-sialidase n=1 Tax=Brachyspira aalborgi TaxID=29522 RepID=A0A5C8GA90_9SPIR|nr:sialidase family protein [Brachyspira aalborgi]TXJ58831.1 exo-alpha-sialidase [Brachyspira aalborgi]
MKSKKISKLFYISFILIFWILIFTLTCKNPSGPGIDFNLRNWYIMSGMAKGPGFTNNITYGSNIIDPSSPVNSNLLFTDNRNIKTYYRIPALLTLPNGNILAFADKRYNGAGDLPNRIEVMVKISANNGTSWTEEKRVTPISTSTMDGNGDTGCVLDRKTGDVLALVAAGQGFLKSTSNDPIRIKVVRSKDGGESWLAPVDITSQVYGAGCKDLTRRNWQAAFVTSGNGLQMRNGRIIFVLNVRQTTSAFVENYILYSDDGGYKWRVSRGSPKNPRGGNEAKVVELNDGSLLMHIRWTPNRLQSRSYDYGETWTDATVITSLPASSSNGDLIVYTSTKNGYDKDRLITLVDSRPWNGKTSGYPGVPVFYVSYDEGMTWTNKKTLYQNAAGYSSLAILKDGSIGILAELGNSWNGPISFLKTSIEWCNSNDNPCSPTNAKK